MLDRMPSVEANHGVYERHVDSYDQRALQPAERVLLSRYRDRWPELSVLDVGVGAGRTAFTFAALAGSYLGIDYSQAMIARARERIGEDETTRFLHCDARTMAGELNGRRFDLVLFSYNGIDSVGHEDRLAILRQARALVAEDGRFFFSSHSLRNLPFRAERPRLRLHRPVRSAYDAVHAARRARHLRVANRIAADAGERGWVQISDDAHGFEGLWYYALPTVVVAQLAGAGFTVEAAYDAEGRPVDPEDPGTGPWLHYLCAPA
jgi:ubiquinone/menaquinone biosynthesis C-methylase UbiE